MTSVQQPSEINSEPNSDLRPLCVDLDGTLVHTDLLLESTLSLIRAKPLSVFQLPFWLLKGKAHLKAEIASRVDFSKARLPLNLDVVEHIKGAREEGRHVVLVTGSHQLLADAVASYAGAGLFDEVQGSSEDINLTNTRKRDWLIERFGENNFDYIGNDTDDLNVWPSAHKAYAVSSEQGIVSEAKTIEFEKVFNFETPSLREYLSLIRIHQWSKNGLILVPLFLDKRFTDSSAVLTIFLAFLAMSLLASATYILNDMLDLQSDRRNTTKSKRVLASGRVSLMNGFTVMGGLFFCVLFLMAFLPLSFNIMLLVYLVATLAYSFALKEHVILDVIMLATLHTLRVIAGTLAIGAQWSFWLLAFSMFVFMSLAIAKRVSELINLQKRGKEVTSGRDYHISDIPILLSMGTSTGFISVLVVALYINSDKVIEMYHIPMILWLVCPVLMYWMGRVWIITARGQMHEDPIVFVMRDRISRIAVGLIIMVVAAAMLL